MVAPSTQALLTQWHWQPTVLLGIGVLSAAYAYAVGPLRRRHDLGPPTTRTQITYFVLAQVLLVVALISPVDAIGDQYLFSVHMVQHLLLAALWPPLILLSLPDWLGDAFFRLRISGVWRALTYPVVALLLFNLDVYAWHLPYLYDLTLRQESIHILEHVSFMFFGVLNWWPVLSPIPEQRLNYPLQVLYLFADGMFMMVLGIVFTFAPTPFYPPYTAAPRLWGISAVSDQGLGGLIMWYPGNIPYAVLLAVAFYRWFDTGGPSSETARITSQSPTIGPPVR